MKTLRKCVFLDGCVQQNGDQDQEELEKTYSKEMKASVRCSPCLLVLFCLWRKTCAALPDFRINSTTFAVYFLAAPTPEVRRLV